MCWSIAVRPRKCSLLCPILSGLELTYDGDGANTEIARDPSFDADASSYTASVGHTTDRITVAATTNNDSAVVANRDTADAEGVDDCHLVALAVGRNTIRVRVTAQDGNTVQTYTVALTRSATSSYGAFNGLKETPVST